MFGTGSCLFPIRSAALWDSSLAGTLVTVSGMANLEVLVGLQLVGELQLLDSGWQPDSDAQMNRLQVQQFESHLFSLQETFLNILK